MKSSKEYQVKNIFSYMEAMTFVNAGSFSSSLTIVFNCPLYPFLSFVKSGVLS